jgi:hypothetical protein
LIKRIESPKGGVQCLPRPAKGSGINIRINPTKIWVIEQIEELGTELKTEPIVKYKLSSECKISLPGAKGP